MLVLVVLLLVVLLLLLLVGQPRGMQSLLVAGLKPGTFPNPAGNPTQNLTSTEPARQQPHNRPEALGHSILLLGNMQYMGSRVTPDSCKY